MASTTNSEVPKVPGWEEALRSLVLADSDYVESLTTESDEATLQRMQTALSEIHNILGTVAHALIVPDDIGRNILSFTEGWENFWMDYDMLSGIHSSPNVAGQNVVLLDISGTDSVDVMAENFKVSDLPENVRLTAGTRRRLLKASTNDFARLIVICARLTAVDILLRQPKKSAVFLSSYFQSFPSFICQTASVANLMTNRAVSDSTPTNMKSIESMISFAAMSLLSTVITETNHVTQALSVLSANNPHTGILANLMNLTLSPSSLSQGEETYPLSKAAIYLLMSSVQNAKHPGCVSNSTMLRRVLEVLVGPSTHPEVTHACCVCLEVTLEFSPSAFTILFRDLDALDKLIERAVSLVESTKQDRPGSNLTAKQKGLSSVFSLLRFSFQTQEIHVGINLHEKLSDSESPLRQLLESVIRSGPSVIGKNVFNGCITLVGNVIADDPLIISTLVDCGLVDELVKATRSIKLIKEADVLSNLFVALAALHLHDSGIEKLKFLGDPLRSLLVEVASDKYLCSASTEHRRRPLWGFSGMDGEENRIIEDIGMIVGQSCDDVIRNKPEMKEKFITATIEGIHNLVSSPAPESSPTLSLRIAPALRMLYGGLLSTSDMVEIFCEKMGIQKISAVLSHPGLEPGSLIQPVVGTARIHPFVSVFKSVGQRCGRPNTHYWQRPLAAEIQAIASLVPSSSEEISLSLFSRVATVCLLANVATPVPTTHGTTSEMPSGAILFIVSELMRMLPQLFAVYKAESKKDSPEPLLSTAWASIKNYITTIAKVCNSTGPHPKGTESQSGRLLSPAAKPLASLLVTGAKRLVEVASPTEAHDLTEVNDILSRMLVEDKNHSIRPMCMLELWRMGAVDSICALLHRVVTENEDASELSSLESLLILLERITSHKRLTNSPLTRTLVKDYADKVGMIVDELTSSVTTRIGRTVFDLHSKFLAMRSLSSTGATAVIKIYSHAVMLADVKKPGEESSEEELGMLPPSVSSKRGRSKSPAKKRPRPASAAPKTRRAKAAAAAAASLSKTELIPVCGDDLTEEIIERYTEALGIGGEKTPFLEKEDGLAVSHQVADEFVIACIRLGDKSGCESNVAELINRHTDYLGVSIVPHSRSGENNVAFVADIAPEECFNNQSRSACAILGSRLNTDLFSSKKPQQIDAYLEGLVNTFVDMSDSEESRLALLKDSRDWIGPFLALLHPVVDFCVFSIELAVQHKLLARVLDFLAISGSEGVAGKSAQAVLHAGLVLVASLIRRRDNVSIAADRVSVLLNLPAKARTVHTAPMITDVLLGVVASDLAIAVKISKGLDAFTATDRCVEEFLESSDFQEIAVRDRRVFEILAKQVLKRKKEKDKVMLIRDEAAMYDFSVFNSSNLIEPVLRQLVHFLVNTSIPAVDKTTCNGLSDLVATEGAYPYTLTVESVIIVITAILSEVALIRDVDDRLNGLQESLLTDLVSQVGRTLVGELSVVKADKSIAVDEKAFKITRVWADGINRCSPWLSAEVLAMVRDELAQHTAELDSDDPEIAGKAVLRSYAYCGLTFLLVDNVDVELKLIEELLPVLAARLTRGTRPVTLCRADAHFGLESMYASLYALASRLREAQVLASKAHVSPGEDSSGIGESGNESSEGEEGDAEMSSDEDDISENDQGVSIDDMPEAFITDEGEEGENEAMSEDDQSDEDEDEMGEIHEAEPEEESESDEEDEEEDSIGESESDYGEYDDFSNYDDYDVEWEEDDEDEEEDEEDGGVDIVGDDGFVDNVEDLGIEVADYMMGGDAGSGSGSGTSDNMSSPLAGPEPAPGALTPPPAGPQRFSPETLEFAQKLMKAILEEQIPELPAEEKDIGSAEGESSNESNEEDDSEELGTGFGDLLNMTEEEQLAALSGLSAEERMSIQQALGIEDDEDFDMDDDDDDDSDVEFELPPNVRITHRPIPANGRMEMMVEVPSDMDTRIQANVITEAINRMDIDRLVGPRPSGLTKKNGKGGEFVLDDEIPKQDQAEKLCADSPQFAHNNIPGISEAIAGSMAAVAAISSRSLMMRNQVPLKPVLDRMFVYLCFDPRTRHVLLENLFSSFLKFVFPKTAPWSFPATDTGVDGSMPSFAGVYDAGLHPLLDRALRVLDLNAPGQCRSVGSGRLVNTLKMILQHVPRARLWFSQPMLTEQRGELALSLNSYDFGGRRTPERPRRRSCASSTPEKLHYTSSDGEGPLVRAVSSQCVIQGAAVINPRKVTPLTVCINLLSCPMLLGSPSHGLLLVSLILQVLEPFPTSTSDAADCDTSIVGSVPHDAVQMLCELLVESKNRLRHMPEFDKALTKVSQILVTLCRDVKMREVVRQRLLATGARLVNDVLARLNQDESFTAVPLVRLFRTAKEAFGTKRLAAGEEETFLDFAPAITNIGALWSAVDTRLAAHNNLLLGAPSVAQQELQKRRGLKECESVGAILAEDENDVSSKIAALETISKLIPLVELFLNAHEVSAVSGSDPKKLSSRAAAVSKEVTQFVERHRRPINSMVKSRPSILNRAFAVTVATCPHMLDFDNKRAFFRTKLRHQDGERKQHAPPQLKVTVRRDDVFRDSYSKLQIRSKEEWRGKLNITFQGEEGVDAGGLVREWYSILAREIFNPNYALFTPASGRPSTFLINPASSVNPDHIHYFKFCGRFIGKAVFDNQRIDAYFVRSFYKHMLGKEVTWRDMETTDPDYFKNLNWILENDMTHVDYYSFTVEENEFGKLKVVELIPDGENIRVTEDNKHEYVRLVCEHKLTKGIQEQLKAFLQGFHELIPEHIVGTLFDDKELEMLISGLPTIDIEDLKRNTDYVHYTASSEQIQWFWRALEGFTEDELAWFLQFVTGSTQVPLEGFKGLAGMNGPQRFSIHRIKVEDRLPTAHTCFNQLDLPEYQSYEVLEAKLKQAVREGHSGFGFI